MAKPTRYTQEMIDEYTKAGYWQPTTLPDIWDRNAKDYPNKEAIVDSKTRLTWAEAKLQMDRVTLGLLELGLTHDQMVVVQLPTCVELSVLRVACEKAGLLCLPALRALRHRDMEYILKTVHAVAVAIPWEFGGFDYFSMIEQIKPGLPELKHVLVVGDKVPAGTISVKEMTLHPLEAKYPSDYLERTKYPATDFSLIGLTSGTTGFPKFAELPICANIAMGKRHAEAVRLTGDDVVGSFSPVPRGPNIFLYFSGPMVGSKSVILESWNPEEALKLIEKERISVFALVPTQASMMITHPNFSKYDLSSLRIIELGGAPVPYSLAAEAEEKLGCRIVHVWSATDSGCACISSPDDPREIRLTTGKPSNVDRVKIVDDSGKEVPTGEVGELLVGGATSSGGYYLDPDATWQAWSKDGWFATGDLAKMDSDLNVMIVGRKKDMIIRGGMNIYPAEIEKLLVTHPKVLDAAVVGMPDSVMGERACAYVVPKPRQSLSFDEMVSFLKEKRVPSYRLPERLEILDRLPIASEAQKVDKKALRQDIALKLKAEGKLG